MQALFHHFLLVVFINAAFINDYRPIRHSACHSPMTSAFTHSVNASSLAELFLEILLNKNLPDTEGEEDPDNHQEYLRIPTGRQVPTPFFASAAFSRVELINHPTVTEIQIFACTNQTGKRSIVFPALQLHIHRLRLF